MLKDLYNGGSQPFFYITLPYDKNINAQNWLVSGYNAYWVPTVYWDGGNIVQISDYNNYNNSINTCKNRAVADIDAAIDVAWLGNATMEISLSVDNNSAVNYDGFIRAYVCELESSLNWRDSAGKLYTFPFLDWAMNQPIQVAAGGTWQSSVTWIGAGHNDGFGNTFGNITPDNIMVIVAVADGTPHQGYSDPPSGAPFDGYWLDACEGARPAFYIDNVDPSFNAVGSWNTMSYPAAHGGTIHFSSPGGSPRYAIWRADTVLDPGRYEVSLWKFSNPYSSFLASGAPYRVHHATGVSGWIPVNWTTSGSEWIPLGTFDFDGVSPQGVVLTNQANGFVVADALKFVPAD